ncbi:MAG: hypothetical protein R6U11_11960 [Bacteroidales bacterium]
MNKIISVILLMFFCSGISALAQEDNNKYNQFDEQGRRQGIWYSYFKDGGMRYQGEFVDDKPVGVFYYYFPEGEIRAEINHNTDEIEEKNASKATFYHKNGNISSEGFYVNKERHGLWRFFNEKGNIISENYYHHGQNHGVWKVYYSHGKVAEIVTWHYGEKHGEWKRFYENGEINVSTQFEHDELSGKYMVYYNNGNNNIIGLYKNNLPHSTWTFFTKKGEKQKVVVYDEGKIVDETIYIEEPEEKMEKIRPGDEPLNEEERKKFQGF